MRHLPIILLAALGGACCFNREPSAPVDKTSVDMSGILRLKTRLGFAHGCPISPTLALTAAHVVDPQPLNLAAPLVSGAWSDGAGHTGVFKPLMTFGVRDLAILEPVGNPFSKWYPIAERGPKLHSKVFMLGYDWWSRSNAVGPRITEAEIMRAFSGALIYSRNSDGGSSGSCILNEQSEVVGVVEGWIGVGFNGLERVGLGVAVFGEEFSAETERDPLQEVDRTTGPTDPLPRP